jgi:hypothetical protein
MFDYETIQNVWEKGRIVKDYDPDVVRKDACGAWIIKNEYGNTSNKFGWEIDHVYPETRGGDDNLQNLRPMQWENNRSKSDNYPRYHGVVKANDNTNVNIETQYTVNEDIQNTIRQLYKL